MVEEEIKAKARVRTAANGLYSAWCGFRTGQAGDPEGQIKLLRLRGTSQQKKQAKEHYKQR